jgi:hypothetical protein
LRAAQSTTPWRGLQWLRKNSQLVIPKGGVCPRNLLFHGSREEKQIPRFALDDKEYFFRSLFSLRGLGLAKTKTRRLKPAPPKTFLSTAGAASAKKLLEMMATW